MNQHQLARLDSPASLLTTPTQRAAELLQAAEPQARALPEADLADQLMEPLLGAAALLGHRNTLAHEDDLLLLAQGVAKMVQRRFAAFNLAEIREAILRGASGDYKTGQPGEILLVSLPAVAEWLAGYQKAARAAAVEAARPIPKQLPAARIDYAGSVLDLVAQANAGKLPPYTDDQFDFGNLAYDWLKALGAFAGWRTGEQWADMQAEEAEAVAIEAQQHRDTYAGRQAYNIFLSALAKGVLPDHPLSKSALNRCRKRVLREWLLEQAANETDVAALLAQLQEAKATTT